jgi:hypothetical protein
MSAMLAASHMLEVRTAGERGVLLLPFLGAPPTSASILSKAAAASGGSALAAFSLARADDAGAGCDTSGVHPLAALPFALGLAARSSGSDGGGSLRLRLLLVRAALPLCDAGSGSGGDGDDDVELAGGLLAGARAPAAALLAAQCLERARLGSGAVFARRLQAAAAGGGALLGQAAFEACVVAALPGAAALPKLTRLALSALVTTVFGLLQVRNGGGGARTAKQCHAIFF